MSETGVVKFRCEHSVRELEPFAEFDELNRCRRKLLQLRMIGVDASGIGFGNISVRDGNSARFYITASGSGAQPHLHLKQVAKVLAYEFRTNSVTCEGIHPASSESLTHAAVYESDQAARAVIHCHSSRLWKQLLVSAPATARDVEYGTPEMAFEVQRLFRESDLQQQRIFAMGGHADGVVAFGANLEEAFCRIVERATSLTC